MLVSISVSSSNFLGPSHSRSFMHVRSFFSFFVHVESELELKSGLFMHVESELELKSGREPSVGRKSSTGRKSIIGRKSSTGRESIIGRQSSMGCKPRQDAPSYQFNRVGDASRPYRAV